MSLVARAALSLMDRPYEAAVSAVLFVAGLVDVATQGYPPEVAASTPDWLLRAYGVWIVVGSACVISGLAFPGRAGTARERFGHSLLATGLGVLFVLLLPQAGADARLLPSLVTCGVFALCSVTRAVYLSPRYRFRRCYIREVGPR